MHSCRHTAAKATMVRPVSLRASGRMSNIKMSAVGVKKTVAPVFDEICEQTGVTLSRYMMEVARQNPDLRDLESLMGGIQQACKTIANLVDRATITGMVCSILSPAIVKCAASSEYPTAGLVDILTKYYGSAMRVAADPSTCRARSRKSSTS